jgi:hypothetical protein
MCSPNGSLARLIGKSSGRNRRISNANALMRTFCVSRSPGSHEAESIRSAS